MKVNIEEPSTWRGIANTINGIATIFGTILAPEFVGQIIGTGLLIAGIIGFSVPDKQEIFLKKDG